MKMKPGTTTVGLIGKDFVVFAADQKASMGHIAADDEALKIYKITDFIAVTIAGGLGDAQAIIRFLKSQANLYEIDRGTKVTPKAMASLLSNILNSNRYFPFIFQPILGGVNNEPQLFEVDVVGGISTKKDYAVTGSGTTFAMTVLDGDYSKNLSEKAAVGVAIKAVNAARRRDIYSGGKSVTVVVVDSQGYRKYSIQEVEKAIKQMKSKVAAK